MRRIGSLLMSTVLVTGCAGLATNNESLRVLLERSGQSQPKLSPYDQGKRHLQVGSAGLAVESFQQALKEHPDSVPALNGLAVAYDRLGRADVAQRYLDHALTVDPNSAVTLNNLAYLNLVQGNTAVALAYAERAKIAAALPMDMMLPETIANAVDRTAEIASQIATNQMQDRSVAAMPLLPPESDVKRVGLNEWELRIRPLDPADAVRINLPRDTTPRVIEPMARPAAPPIAMDPVTEAVIVSDIPDSVMADLVAPPPEPAPAEAVVASLPQEAGAMPPPVDALAPTLNESPPPSAPALPAPADVVATPAPESLGSQPVDAAISEVSAIPEPVIASLLDPPANLPEPVREAPVVAALPAIESAFVAPAPEAIAAVLPVLPVIPPQELPAPAREELVVAALPATESVRTFVAPAPEAIAAVLPVLPVIPPQELPAPAREELVVAALPASEPMPVFSAPALEAIAAPPPAPPILPSQQLPEPVRKEAVVTTLSQLEPVEPPTSFVAPVTAWSDPVPASAAEMSSASATARLKEVLASLSAPASPPAMPVAPVPEAPKPTEPVAATAVAPAAPMVASLAPPRADAPRSVEPASMATGWRASVPASTRVRVSNGTGRRLMAGRFARYFGEHGLFVRLVANANSFDYRRTVIFYNPDQRAHAEALAAVLPFPVRLAEAKQGRGEIELVLGFDLLGIDDSLRSA